jgi:hypothetical protein
MSTSQHNIATPLDVIKRRPVGKGAWKLTIQDLLESERLSLQHLRSISDKRPEDAAIQRLVANAALEAGERISQLQELMHYKDEKPNENGETK